MMSSQHLVLFTLLTPLAAAVPACEIAKKLPDDDSGNASGSSTGVEPDDGTTGHASSMSTSSTSSVSESSTGTGTGTGTPPRDVEALCEGYCEMQEACMIQCADGCLGPTCRTECPQWFAGHLENSGEACATPFAAWLECIGTATCEEAIAWFSAHPDGLTPTTPCFAEYDAMECADWEPL